MEIESIQELTALREMDLYARYLTGIVASQELCERYARAVALKLPKANASAGAVAFILKNNWALPLLDNATGWMERSHPLRPRLELAFAILETSTEAAPFFLPGNYSPFYIIALGFRGMKSLLFALTGKIILLFL